MTSGRDIARDESVERFRLWLKTNNLPATPQRVAIATIVLGAASPLSAEEVVERLRANGPAPGTATVYRTIDALIRCGLVLEEDKREGFRRFVPVRDDVSMDELLCTECGNVTPVAGSGIAERVSDAATAAGFVAVRHRLTVYGLCAACASRRGSAQA